MSSAAVPRTAGGSVTSAAAMGVLKAWFPYPFLTPKGGTEGGVLKPKSDSLLLCVTFNPLLFLAIVLSSNERCWETYHIKNKTHSMNQGGMKKLGRWD